ncbi:MAG: hypothetical protein LBF09_05565 [Odoribacteraceae bacterium]|jgi:hypothetical protein|nr:hypothetical protein [Odoribacteraceae bacterium]
MKQTLYIIAALLLLARCVEDTGNYTYEAPAAVSPVILSTLAEEYEAISLQQFVIDPRVEGNEDDYTYAWYVYPINHTAIPYDTIGHERKLDYRVAIQSGTYTLIFKVTEKQHGTSVYQRSRVTVSSIFGKGYYINKHQNGRADVDFIDRDGVITPNLLKQLNGDDLPGIPIRSTYVSNQYYYETLDPDGNPVRSLAQPAFMICTDQDARVYHGDNMRLLKAWDSLFLEQPAVKRPAGIWGSTGGFMLLNDNSPHFVYNNGYGIGKFGYAYPSDGYKLSRLVTVGYAGYLAFDENAGSFVGYYPQRNTPYTEAYPGYLPNCVNQELLWSAPRHMYETTSLNSYSITRDRDDNTIRVISSWPRYIQNGLFVFERDYLIPPTVRLAEGTAFTCHGGGSVSSIIAGHEAIYYSTGDNRVHYYNLANQTERRDAVTIPDGESIAYIHHAYDYYWQVNHFIILANKGNQWKMYVHDMEGSTPDNIIGGTVDIVSTPTATYTGDGTAVNLIYRHPNTKLTY